MNRLRTLTVLATSLALGAVGATTANADAAARHAAAKAVVTGFEVQTSDHNSYGDGAIVVSNNGSYSMGCDTILYIDADVTGKHVQKHTAYSYKATYAGTTTSAYASSWTKSGTAKVVLPEVMRSAPTTSGTLTLTVKAKHKVIGKGSLRITLAGCHTQ